MASRVHSQHGTVPIAKLLAVEAQVGKLTSEMEKLILISTQHGSRIKELIVASTNSVSQVEMMSVVTTGRFQHINDLKALRSNLQMKYEQSQPGVSESLFPDEAESKEIKALSARILDLQNEASNAQFKNGMEVNKLKVELKESKRDFDDLKRFVTALESKLGCFIQDAKDNGIKTNIGMEDMPEITIARSSDSRKGSILSNDGQLSPHNNNIGSPFPFTEGQGQEQSAEYVQQMQSNQSHSTIATDLSLLPELHNVPHTNHAHTHNPHNTHNIHHAHQVHAMHAQQHQQHQQYLHYHQQMSAHSSYSQIYGVPISDSGLSSHTHSHTNLVPSASQHSHALDQHNAAYHLTDQNSVPTLHTLGSAHRTLQPPHYSHYPMQYVPYVMHSPNFSYNPNPNQSNHNSSNPNPSSVPVPYTHPYYTQLQTLYPEIEHSDLSHEDKVERYYKTQFKAMKELIMASLEGGKIDHMQPSTADESSNDVPVGAAASCGGAVAVQENVTNTNNPSSSMPNHVPNIPTTSSASATNTTNTTATTDTTINLRHRNRDLFYNLQRVKEVQTIALSYADFCVNNAINVVDGAAYDKFQETLFESELDRFHTKALSQGTAEVQTDVPYPNVFNSNYTGTNSTAPNTGNNTAMNSPEVISRKNSVFGSAKLPANKKRNSMLLRSQSERVRSPGSGTRGGSAGSVGYGNGGLSAGANGDSEGIGFEPDDYGNADTDNTTSSKVTTSIRAIRTPSPVDGPRAMMQALQQLREEAALEAEEHDEVTGLANLELPDTAPLLDFGDALLPTLYSSTGRRHSLSLSNPMKAASFRDPALDFLDIHDHTNDTTSNTITNTGSSSSINNNANTTRNNPNNTSSSNLNIGSDDSGDHFGPGLLLASKTPSFRNSFMAKRDANRPGSSGTNGANNNNNSTNNAFNIPTARGDSSTTNSTDIAQLRTEMKTLMDKKLLSLYNALDARWQGLDSTNTGILHKLSRFQDVITDINEDNQRILSINQALSIKTLKLESRMFEALEPVYTALQSSRDSVSSLEGLMVDVAKKIEFLKTSAPAAAKTGAEAPLRAGPAFPQLPIETLLKNSTKQAELSAAAAGVTTDAGGDTSLPAEAHDPAELYHIPAALAPQPAHLMTDYELEIVFRQLKEYSTLYKDMMHNYGALMKRLVDEDMRKSGNFALKKPRVAGTVEVLDSVCEPLQHNEDHTTAHTPHQHTSHSQPHTAAHTEHILSYPSPHRIVVNKAPLATKRDVQIMVENADLSAHIEIVRIKNELAIVRNILNIRNTSPSRQRGQIPTTTFPSLFSNLGTGEFSLPTVQRSGSPGSGSGSPLRSRPPTSGGFNSANTTAAGGGNGSGRSSSAINSSGALQGTRIRIPLEFSLNDELKSLSMGESTHAHTNNTAYTTNNTPYTTQAHNTHLSAPYTAPTAHSSNNDLYISAQNSYHSRSITANTDGGYSVGGLEEDVGLDSQSLSAYDFLLNPPQQRDSVEGAANPASNPTTNPTLHTTANPANTTTASHSNTTAAYYNHTNDSAGVNKVIIPTASTDKIIIPGTPVARPSVHIVHAPVENTTPITTVRPKSRSVVWGSSAAISTNISNTHKDAMQREGSFKGNKTPSNTVRESIKPTSAVGRRSFTTTSPEGKRKGSIGASATTISADVYKEGTIRNVEVNMRADAIISGEPYEPGSRTYNNANSATNNIPGDVTSTSKTSRNSVRTGMTVNPTPPSVSRPLSTHQVRKVSINSSTTNNANNGGGHDHTINTTHHHDYDPRLVWQSTTSSDIMGSEVAATPSVILQGGEYVPSEHFLHSDNTPYTQNIPAVRPLHSRENNTADTATLNVGDQNMSVDSVPANALHNLGENAFENAFD